jgi:hypothetical protein
MRTPVAAALLTALLAVPAQAGSPGSSAASVDGATAPAKIFQNDDPTAGRSGSITGVSCAGSSGVGGPCVSAGAVGQVTAPLPPGLIVTGPPKTPPAAGR